MRVSKRTKISLYILLAIVALLSFLEAFVFLFITLPLLLLGIGYYISKQALTKLPEGLLSIFIAVLAGGAGVFLAAVVLYTAIEMIYYDTSNADLDRQEILLSAGQTARNVTVFLAFLFSYFNFLKYLDNRKQTKNASR